MSMPSPTSNHSTLRISNWPENIGPNTIASFEAETGIDVHYETYESIEELEHRVLAGGSGLDVIFTASTSAERFIASGLLEQLDFTALPNRTNLSGDILKQLDLFDPGTRFLVPYMWGTIGVSFDADAIASLLPGKNLADLDVFFDRSNIEILARDGIALFDSPVEAFALVLNYLGEDPFSPDPEIVAKAERLLADLFPYLRYVDSVKPIEDLAKGSICAALAYSGVAGIAGNIAQQAGRNVKLTYLLPVQGTLLWIDNLAIMAGTQNKAAALRFLDFMMRPEVAAQCSSHNHYANANASADRLVAPEIAKDLNIYPAAEALLRLFTARQLSPEAEQLRLKAWSRLCQDIAQVSTEDGSTT